MTARARGGVDLRALQTALASVPRCTAPRDVSAAAAKDEDASTGRIAAALEGDANWHEARRAGAAPAPRGATALLRVAHAPAVVVRAAPHLDAEVVTYARAGTTLLAVARRGLWVRLAEANFPSATRDWPEAWLLLAHEQHGRLVDVLSGDLAALPEPALALPSAGAVAHAEPCASVRRMRSAWRVRHAPYVVLRASPSLGARVLGARAAGALLHCDAQCGDWLRLATDAGAAGSDAQQEQPWVLSVHDVHGQLLQRVES